MTQQELEDSYELMLADAEQLYGDLDELAAECLARGMENSAYAFRSAKLALKQKLDNIVW